MARDTMTKRMLKLQRSALNMMLDSMSDTQEKSGRAVLSFLEHMSRLPQENVKTMTRWMDSVKATHAEFNSIMRDNYHSWDNMLGQAGRHIEQASQSSGKLKETGSKKALAQSPPPPERSAQSPPDPGHAKEAVQSPAKTEETGSKKALAQSPPPPEPSAQSSQAQAHLEEAAKSPAKPKRKGSKKAFDQSAQSAEHAAATPVPGKPRKKASKKGPGLVATQSRKSGKKAPKKG